MTEAIREATPAQLVAVAPTVWAMLAAVGWASADGAYWTEESIRERYESLVVDPDFDSTSAGRLTLTREWDGDDFVGISLSIEVTTVYAKNLPSDFPTGTSPCVAAQNFTENSQRPGE